MRVNKIDQCQSLYLVSVLLSIVYEITSAFHYKNNKEELWKDMSRKFNIFQAPSILVHSRLIHSADLDLPFSGGRVFRTNGKKKKPHTTNLWCAQVLCTCRAHPGCHVTVAPVSTRNSETVITEKSGTVINENPKP